METVADLAHKEKEMKRKVIKNNNFFIMIQVCQVGICLSISKFECKFMDIFFKSKR